MASVAAVEDYPRISLVREPEHRLSYVLAHFDYVLLALALSLYAWGLLLIHSATVSHHGFRFVSRQLAWGGIGLVVMLLVAWCPGRWLRRWSFLMWLLCLGGVLLVYSHGTVAYGARRWLSFGPFRLQPSEFLKVALIVRLASLAASHHGRINTPSAFIHMTAVGGVTFVAILKQPDLGTAMVAAAVTAAILFVSGLDAVFFTSIAALGIVPMAMAVLLTYLHRPVAAASTAPFMVVTAVCGLVLVLAGRFWSLPFTRPSCVIPVTLCVMAGMALSPLIWSKLNPYQRKRLTTFLEPQKDARGAGYNLIQSRIAIGSGGVWGKGLWRGTQNMLGFLPHKHTDFIFSVLAEEMGFMGVAGMLVLMALFLFRAVMICLRAATPFDFYLGCGVVTLFAMHFLVNMGMTMGLMPITGLPLLLVSYGGSALISSFCCIGLLMNVCVSRAVIEDSM